MLNEIISNAEEKFRNSIDHFKSEIAVIRSSQTSPAIIEDIEIQAYDGKYTLKELAAISIPEPNVILIQPWDQSIVASIENGLNKSEFGFTPTVDGTNIRIAIPPLSEEKRKELVKVTSSKTEESKVAIRNIRQEKMKSLDSLCDESMISEDEHKQARKQIQDLVDQTNVEIEKLKESKVESILGKLD